MTIVKNVVDPDFPYQVKISTRRTAGSLRDKILEWNNITADIVEQFGLPGDRFVTTVDELALTLYFKTEQDLLLFKLKWSEYEL